jgi:hypothetical protein
MENENETTNANENLIQVAVGVAVLFGTVWLISRAWKKGQA